MFLTLLLCLFYAIGLAILAFAGRSAYRSRVASTWPTTPGTIQSCELETSTDDESGPSYEVKVRYAYTVAWTPYTGTRIAYGYTGSNDHAAQRQLCDKLQHARAIDVRYDPRDPASSTLSFGLHRSIRFLLAFGLTWLIFVTGFAIIWRVASGPDDVLLNNLVTR